MTTIMESAAAVHAPCDSCATAARALRILSDSLKTAQEGMHIISFTYELILTLSEALAHIRVPVPPGEVLCQSIFTLQLIFGFLDVALAMGYRSAQPDEMPQQLHDLCRNHGYMVLEGMLF